MKRRTRIICLLCLTGFASILTGCWNPASLAWSPYQRDIARIYGPPAARYRTESGGEVWAYRIPVLTREQFQDLAERDPKVAEQQRVKLSQVEKLDHGLYEFEIEFDRHGYICDWRWP